MVNLILWAILGAASCLVTTYIIGGERSRRTDIITCIVGAAAGEVIMFILNSVMGSAITSFNLYSFIIAVIGVIAVLGFLQNKKDNVSNIKARQKRSKYNYNSGQETYEI